MKQPPKPTPDPDRKPVKSFLHSSSPPPQPNPGQARPAGPVPSKPAPPARPTAPPATRRPASAAPGQTQPDVDAYELEEHPAPAKPPEAINRSYLVTADPAAPPGSAAPATEKEPEPPPGQPKPVDPAEAARKREEARKRGAEMWAEEEARRTRKRLITIGVLLLITIAAATVLYFKLR